MTIATGTLQPYQQAMIADLLRIGIGGTNKQRRRAMTSDAKLSPTMLKCGVGMVFVYGADRLSAIGFANSSGVFRGSVGSHKSLRRELTVLLCGGGRRDIPWRRSVADMIRRLRLEHEH
jgi:hypothetical protein